MNKKLDDALTRLAELFDYGSIQATATPVDFINRVSDEIIENRKRIAELKMEVEDMKGQKALIENEIKKHEVKHDYDYE